MSKKVTQVGLAVPPPPSRQRTDFARMEEVTQTAAENMKGKKLQDMSFKVELEFHDRLKMAALKSRMRMKDIFIEAVDDWIAKRWPNG